MPTGVKRIMRRQPRAASEYEEEEERPRRRRDEDDEETREERPRSRRRDEDDEEEERPSRRSRARDDDEEEERPRRSRSRVRDDEEEEDDRPRRRSRVRDDDDEEDEDRPRRRSRARDDDDEDDRPRRRSRRDEDEDEDDRPRSRRSSRSDDDDDDYEDEDASGWKGAAKVRKDMPSDFAGDFIPPNADKNEDPAIVKFLQEEPFYTYRQHWCEWLPAGSKLGHLCPKVDCPLCDAGVKVRAMTCFNIVDLSDPKHPTNKIWRVGIKLQRVLERMAQQPRTGPLDRADLYFEVFRTGGEGRKSGGQVQTNINPIKARDLYEEYKIEPLEDDEIESLEKKLFKKADAIQPTPKQELRQIARAIRD